MSQEEKKRRKRKKESVKEFAKATFDKPKPVAIKIKVDEVRGVCCAECRHPVANCVC